jgi:hypothetical protein
MSYGDWVWQWGLFTRNAKAQCLGLSAALRILQEYAATSKNNFGFNSKEELTFRIAE